MTPQEFIKRYKKKHPESHFFDEDTLEFFGEQISEMKLSGPVNYIVNGEDTEVYILDTHQHNAPGGPVWKSHFFRANDFESVYPTRKDFELQAERVEEAVRNLNTL